MNYFQHSGFPWSVENQGKTKIFQGQEKVRDFFEKLKEIENEDRDIGDLQKSKQMLACITGIIFSHFQTSKVKAGSE